MTVCEWMSGYEEVVMSAGECVAMSQGMYVRMYACERGVHVHLVQSCLFHTHVLTVSIMLQAMSPLPLHCRH